jgi:quinol monooxygenase YgiN
MTPQGNVPAFIINTTYRIHPDDVAAYKALAVRFSGAASLWEGCDFASVGQDVLDPATFHLIEGWQDRAVFDAFIASEEFQGVLREAMRLRVVDRFGDVIFVSGMDPLEMPS